MSSNEQGDFSMNKRVLATILAVAFATAAIGCGSSGGDSGDDGGSASTTSESSTLTKKQFIEQADAICAKSRKKTQTEFASYLKEKGIKEIGEQGESPAETKAREVEVIETLGIPALSSQQEEIRALGVPSGDAEAKVEAYLDAGKKGLEEGEADPALLYNSPEKVFAESDKLAKEIGFKVCGNR